MPSVSWQNDGTTLWMLESVALAVHQMLLAEHGGNPGVRDPALLDSALTRPKQRFVDEPDATLFELAAAYSYGLAKTPPFIDGNKRVALAVGNLTEAELAGWLAQSC